MFFNIYNKFVTALAHCGCNRKCSGCCCSKRF